MICHICGEDHPRGIGGTGMARILGLVKKTNALDIFHDLTRPVRDDRDEETIDQHRGHVLEPLAAPAYWKKTGRDGEKSIGTTTHPDFPAFQCHLDYNIFADKKREKAKRGPGVLELKAPRAVKFRRVSDKGLFQSELVQAFTYGAVARLDWVSLAFYNLEDDAGPIIFLDQILDPAMSAFLLEAGQRFMDEHVTPRVAPDPDEWELLAKEDAPKLVDLSGELTVIEDKAAVKIGRALLEAKEVHKEAEALFKDRKTDMQAWMENVGLRRIQIPKVGKFTVVQNQGKKTFSEPSLRLARPLDWDLVRARLLVEASDLPADQQPTDEQLDTLLETLALDLSRFQRQGDPHSHVLPTAGKDV